MTTAHPALRPIHPLARALPPMTDAEFRALRDDIAFQGQLEPITILAGAVLDGIHRQRACHELGGKFWPPRSIEYAGDAPAAFVIARNVRRRHLSVGQQAAVAASLARYYRSKYPKTSGADLAKVSKDLGLAELPDNSGTSLTDKSGTAHHDGLFTLVAKSVGVDRGAVETFETLRKQTPELAAQVAAGEKPLYAADAERKTAARAHEASTAPSRRRTKSEAAAAAVKALQEAVRDYHAKVRVMEALRFDVDPDFFAATLKAAEQAALEHRRLVEDAAKKIRLVV